MTLTDFFLFILCTLMFVAGVLLIMIVLVQRGKGGGLAGALGGAGGSSALGVKAMDNIFYVTLGMAAFWIVISVLTLSCVKSVGEVDLDIKPTQTPSEVGLEPAPEDDETDANE